MGKASTFQHDFLVHGQFATSTYHHFPIEANIEEVNSLMYSWLAEAKLDVSQFEMQCTNPIWIYNKLYH